MYAAHFHRSVVHLLHISTKNNYMSIAKVWIEAGGGGRTSPLDTGLISFVRTVTFSLFLKPSWLRCELVGLSSGSGYLAVSTG